MKLPAPLTLGALGELVESLKLQGMPPETLVVVPWDDAGWKTVQRLNERKVYLRELESTRELPVLALCLDG